jgi:hypothetical protein
MSRERRGGERGEELGKQSGGSAAPGRRTLTEQLPMRREVASERGAIEPETSQLEERMTQRERDELIADARERVTKAFPAFGLACAAERDAVRETAKENLAFFGLLFDIGLGLLMPGLGKAFAALRATIPADWTAARRLAEALSNEYLSGLVGIATSKAREKLMATVPADQSEIDAYLTRLAKEFDVRGSEISEGLRDQDDATILAIWAAFDRNLASQEEYGRAVHELVGKYQKAVSPIGADAWNVSHRTIAVDVIDGVAVRGLALVEHSPGSSGNETGTGELPPDHPWARGERLRFVRWIPPELHQVARNKTRAVTGGEVRTVLISQIDM